MCPGHSSRDTEAWGSAAGLSEAFWAGQLPSLLGPDARPAPLQSHSPACGLSLLQRHSRPGHARASPWTGLAWTPGGLKASGRRPHPHLLGEDGTDRRQAPLKPKSHRRPEDRGDSKGGLGICPLAISPKPPP